LLTGQVTKQKQTALWSLFSLKKEFFWSQM